MEAPTSHSARAQKADASDASAVNGQQTTSLAQTDHDHSGDHLGVGEPVASIDVNTISTRDFDSPGNFLVVEDDGTWYAYRTSDETAWFEGTDGGAVINSAIEAAGEPTVTKATETGRVRVLADEGGTRLRTSTTIDHTYHGVTLTFEPGIVFEYTGTGEAVEVGSGNNHHFYFDVIDANGADYCIRNTGVGTGETVGNTLRGASDSLYFLDAASYESAYAGQYIDIRELDCTAHLTPYGFRTNSGESGCEGYWVDLGVVRGPTEAGIVVGDETTRDSVGFFLFNAAIDGEINDARRLVTFNDQQHGVVLQGFTPATGGDWDVEMDDLSLDCPVVAPAHQSDLRVKREILQTADLSKFDPFGHEVVATNLSPDSLDAYERVEQGTGAVVHDATAGRIEHRTGAELESRAALSRRLEHDAGMLSFDEPGVVQTSLIALDDIGQRARLVWGDPAGQAIGWRIRDDVLEGYVSDGHDVTTLPLREDFYAGDAWNLTAFYNPPTDVVYYVDDLATQHVSLTGDDSSILVTVGAKDGSEGFFHEGRDARYGGEIATNLPSGTTDARTVMSIDLRNTVTESKQLLWSNWKQYQYPVGDSI